MDNLVENQLMKEVSRGKYQTDFVILGGNGRKVIQDIYGSCFPEYYEKLMAFLTQHKDKLSSGKFNLNGFVWERLLWIYIHMITDFSLNKFKTEKCNKLTCSLYDGMKNKALSDPNVEGREWLSLFVILANE